MRVRMAVIVVVRMIVSMSMAVTVLMVVRPHQHGFAASHVQVHAGAGG